MFGSNQKSFSQLFIICTVFGGWLFTALTAAAQTTAFTYQGRLTDSAPPVPAVYEMEFKLFDAETGGAQKGATVVVPSVAAGAGGVFTVQLDFGFAAYNLPVLYLEIGVRPANGNANFTTLNPRQRVTSVPSAVTAISAENADTAFNADRLGDVPAAQFARTNDPRFTDSRSPTAGSANYVQNNSSTTAQTGSFNLTGGGTLGGSFSANSATVGGLTVNGNASQTGTTADLNLTNGFVARGTFDTGAIPATGAGTRMMFYPRKSAFRAGFVEANQWNDSNIGVGSIALGASTAASGVVSTALGRLTTASGNFSTAMGDYTTASGEYSTAMGDSTMANGETSTAMGGYTTASGIGSTAMGYETTASGEYSTAMGESTAASGSSSTAMGGSTTASGSSSTAMGQATRASGNFSTALGYLASTNGMDGSFVYGDRSIFTVVNATAPNQFVVRAQNIWLGKTNAVTNTADRFLETSTGAYLSTGGTWTNSSSVKLKTNFAPVNTRSILRKVLDLPIQTWNYKTEDAGVQHIGAMAQDFQNVFKLSADDEHISTVDADGVALAAIQGLNAELNERATKLEAENESLKEQLKTQQTQITRQQTAIDALTKLICANSPAANICRQEEK